MKIGENFIIIEKSWNEIKNIIINYNLPFKYEENIHQYEIIVVDSIILYRCLIYLDGIPGNVSLTDEENEENKIDFESNYKNSTAEVLTKVAVTGVVAQAPAKGLGGFVPDPTNNPYQPSSDELVSLYVDGEGSLVTRGAIITDEGSLRDDFTGTSLITELTGTLHFTNGSDIVTGTGTLFTQEINRDNYIKASSDNDGYWLSVIRAPNNTYLQLDGLYQGPTASVTGQKTRWLPVQVTTGSIDISSSVATISSGTSSSGSYYIYRGGDYLPLVSVWTISVSQRINNQTTFIGIRDNIDSPKMYCDVIFDGISNTAIKFRSAWNSDEESSSVTLPSGLDTSQSLRYKIDVSIDYCTLMINGVLVARHEKHIPDPYIEMFLCAGVTNTGATSNTNLNLDTVLFLNQDQIQISSNYTSPISVITKEDQHTITGKLITSSTTADQVIISYTVPAGRVFYLIGYRIESTGSLNGNPVKIGKNTVTNIPSSPGTVDDNVFRALVLSAGTNTGEVDFGSNPRKLGVGGDVIKVTVTPSGLLSSTWYAFLDFVLR